MDAPGTREQAPRQGDGRPRGVNIDDSVIARFWAKVEKGDGCWEWNAARNRGGYGQLQIGRRPYVAHRVSWTIANGPIPDGLIVRHTCDNPPCVRPDHLETGTLKDNAQDTVLRGRKPTSYDYWVEIGAAAASLGLTTATLRQQVKAGKLKGDRFRGSPWHIRRSEVERYRAEHLGKRGRPAKETR